MVKQAINLSILDFKFQFAFIKIIKNISINLSILDFKSEKMALANRIRGAYKSIHTGF